jgi:ribonuclease-3
MKFQNRILLIQAMITQSHSYGTHKYVDHWANLSNERLEFLGDMILHYIATCFLLRHFPYSRPNIPHAYRSRMCMNSLLGKLAIEKFQLHEMLVIRNPIREDQVTQICSNAMEALIAAIYLDQGMKKTTEFFNQFLLKDLFTKDAPRSLPTER